MLLISVIYLIVQAQFIVPPPMDDQLNYFSTAADLPPDNPKHQESRIGLLIPVALLINIFGYSEIAYYLIPFGSALILILGTYIIGRTVFDRWVAAFASLLIVVNPYFLWHSSHLLPDIPATAALTLGLGLLMYASATRTPTDSTPEDLYDTDRHGKPSTRTVPEAFFLVSGILFGIAYLIREFTPVLFGVAVAVLLINRQPWRRWALVGTGAFAAFSIELVWNWVLYGNPVNRLLIAAGHGGSGTSRFDQELLAVAGDFWEGLLEFNGGIYWIILAAALAVIPLCLKFVIRERIGNGWVLYVWVVGVWLFMVGIGALPSLIAGEQYVILRTHKMRYWFPIMPALTVGGLGYIGSLFPTKPRPSRVLRVLLLSALVVAPAWMGLAALRSFHIFTTNGATHYEKTQELLAKRGAAWERIWALDDAWRATTRALPMYTKSFWGDTYWDGEIQPINDGGDFTAKQKLDAGLYVFHPRAIGSVLPSGDGGAPDYVQSPSRAWSSVLVSTNGELALFDLGVQPETVSLYQGEASEWQAIGLGDSVIEETRPVIGRDEWSLMLQPRERAFVMDGQARGYESPSDRDNLGSGFPRGEIEIASSVGGSIAGSVPAGIPNGHRVALFCFVYHADGTREQHLAVAAPFGNQLDRLGFVCPPVDATREPVGVRVGIKAVGEATIQASNVDIWWESLHE